VPKAIQDEFSDLPISRQRKYQLRMKREKRCQICGAPVVMGARCLKHLVEQREKGREQYGLKRRYRSTLSYRLEAMAKESARRQRRKKTR
jgi:hypothetical protein